jgi:hypothetical protein
MEKFDFKNWLKYYTEGTQNKYASYCEPVNIKLADSKYWESPDVPGYFIPLSEKQEATERFDFNQAKAVEDNTKIQEEKNRQAIEAQRKKIVSRLDSIEKLLRSKEGHDVAGDEAISLIQIVHDLKSKIYSIKKASRSNAIYQDLIIREANKLTNLGFVKSASVLNSFAQEIPAAAAPPSPMGSGGGQLGDIPGIAPGEVAPGNNSADLSGTTQPAQTPPAGPMDQTAPMSTPALAAAPVPTPPPAAPEKAKLSPGMQGFLDGLQDVNIDLEEDTSDASDGKISTAQDAGLTPAPEDKKDLEIHENEPAKGTKFDDIIDTAFNNLTVDDVIEKLEVLSKIFKTREVPRQLSIVDMMLDRLGLASFFPGLAEAMNKSIDSNQYVSTRVEDILSKLRGTLAGGDMDLTSEPPASSDPNVARIKEKLQQQESRDKEKKELRKQVEDDAIAQKLKPEAEVENDLGEATPPVAAPTAPAAPAKPPATI